MEPFAFGVRYPDGAPLFTETGDDDLIKRLGGVTDDARRVDAAPWTFDVRPPKPQARLDLPSEAGWTYLVADDDPDRDALIDTIEPLAVQRGMAKPHEPLLFPANTDRGDWIDQEYTGLGGNRPRYLLMVGDPTRLSFPLQVDLAAAGALVGRLAFSIDDPLDAYRAYVEKVIELEKATDAVPTENATVIATNGGPLDATTYSSRYLAPPVTNTLQSAGLKVLELTGPAATIDGFHRGLTEGRPALVFTATHGAGVPAGALGADGQPVDAIAVNGAWACAPSDPGEPANRWDWLRAADLPTGAIAHGGLVVQFACFGYGTTDHSSFAEWLGNKSVVEAAEPFVAAIPQRLLARPDGPIAYVGHVDIALAYGFVDPGGPVEASGFSRRVQPFLTLIGQSVAELTPIGFAIQDLHERATSLSAEIASTFDHLEATNTRVSDLDPVEKAKLISQVIRRNDAMHFLVLGDPAVRVRI